MIISKKEVVLHINTYKTIVYTFYNLNNGEENITTNSITVLI